MMQAKDLRWDDVEGFLARELSKEIIPNGLPAERSVRRWASKNPHYPESLLEGGMVKEDDLLPGLRVFLDHDHGMNLSQHSAFEVNYKINFDQLRPAVALLLLAFLFHTREKKAGVHTSTYSGLKRLRAYS